MVAQPFNGANLLAVDEELRVRSEKLADCNAAGDDVPLTEPLRPTKTLMDACDRLWRVDRKNGACGVAERIAVRRGVVGLVDPQPTVRGEAYSWIITQDPLNVVRVHFAVVSAQSEHNFLHCREPIGRGVTGGDLWRAYNRRIGIGDHPTTNNLEALRGSQG